MLKITILNFLLMCHRVDRMASKTLLKAECRNAGHVGDTEFETALGELIAGHFVDSIEQKLTGDLLYFITNLGRAVL
jgi:hypothetical protein